MKIRKHSGELVSFSVDKLRASLYNSGAKQESVDFVATEIMHHLYDGISSKEVYKLAHNLLKKKEYVNASKYHLKQSLLELGPTGYPFEVFVGELMKAEGYEVKTGNVMQGRCVTHEVDVLGQNEDEVLMIECKFHNRPGYKSDVKVPLYIHSRFRDLDAFWKQEQTFGNKPARGAVFTNSRFTLDALTYGECSGLEMISWDYPHHKSLKLLINEHMLYPITSLQSLTKRDKQLLIEEGIVVTKSLCEHFDVLDKLRYPERKVQKIILEANLICER